MDDFASDSTTTGLIEPGGSVTGELEAAGDRDWFAISLVEGESYRFDLRGAPSGVGTLGDPFLRVFDAEGAQLAENDDASGRESQIFGFTAPATGTFFLSAGAFADSEAGTYALSAVSVTGDIAGDLQTDAVLEVDDVITGSLQAISDEDWYRVALEADVPYRIVFDAAAPADGLLDTNVVLYDENGDFVASADAFDGNPAEFVTGVPAAGSYFVAVRSFFSSDPAFFDTPDNFTLEVRELARDPLPAGPETTAVIDVNSTVSGNIEFVADSDWYRVTLEAGEAYTFEVSPDGPDSFFFGGQLELRDASGAVLVSGDEAQNFGDAATIERFSPDTSGAFLLSVSSSDDFIRFVPPEDGGDNRHNYQLFAASLEPVVATGTEGGDTLTGGAGPDQLTGLGGNDVLDGFDGNDLLDGGAGADQLRGGAGEDTILGGEGRDSIAGAEGRDSIDGGAGRDIIGAGEGADTVRGGDGDDGIRAGRGDDIVSGGDGDDRLSGGAGRDMLLGGDGADAIGAGLDDDIVYAGRGDDIAGGGFGDDILFLGAGDDTAFGGRGDDRIDGGAGDDMIQGGTGDDTIAGGAGDDTMEGGFGGDVFVFEVFNDGETDTITDFDQDSFQADRLMLGVIADADDLDPFAAFDSLSITDTDSGTEIAVAGHLIVLENVSAADLSVSDFIFV